ncbi:tyrosinase family oxidase copper chaperone [Streptomyces sp. NPDC101118]|uniref:tyrosinase family oxidase copper chaperone n=1 Tax=Streptomyces sp. NPDC101118 TaxID=3366109 RepID=UPI003818A0C8
MSASSGNIGIARAAGALAVSRRLALRTAFTAAVVAATAAALAPVVRAGRAGRRTTRDVEPTVPVFEETYRGRHITAVRYAAHAPGARERVAVYVDGRSLHVMRRADGSWLSGVNHYESFPSPRALARAAVDELGSARLAEAPAHHA